MTGDSANMTMIDEVPGRDGSCGHASEPNASNRRGLLIAGAGAMALMAFPALLEAAPAGRGAGAGTLAMRRLLTRASRDAFAELSRPDGFWNSTVARINLPTLFDRRAAPGRGPLASPAFREELKHKLNTLAQAALPRVQATTDRSIARLLVRDPGLALTGDATAATTVLRRAMGPRLINAMIPPLAKALRDRRDPTIQQATASLKGVGVNDVAQALANETDNAIWYQIGAAEAAIRRTAGFSAG